MKSLGLLLYYIMITRIYFKKKSKTDKMEYIISQKASGTRPNQLQAKLKLKDNKLKILLFIKQIEVQS